jgi:hypothetical protein
MSAHVAAYDTSSSAASGARLGGSTRRGDGLTRAGSNGAMLLEVSRYIAS